MSLRVATSDDWPLWRDLRVAALTEAPHAFRARLADWESGGREQWRARLTAPGTHPVVALRDGRPVGVVRGVPGDGGTSELRSLWVASEARGQGIGDRLIEAVTTWALRAGSTTLRLAVIPGNEAALALYRRHGFVPAEAPGEPPAHRMSGERVLVRPLR
ncbi:GNAT family N-acetyltransferase [Streptomyces sedi]|uniref:GNAT family N-acetyltransferase n=1 Tax=Streptomyces sedi TaxID=555059 RepID=A0A5C4UYY8_9ACTN|nr:GNAT family N-acetyltransferase [Streptomyces sedi]TNM28807.1 GNAT family N-acetyltransferase [Streptomyces sedi]